MFDRRAIVDKYMDGFRRSDHDVVLSCLTEDVVWEIHGHRTTTGRVEFDDEIENPEFDGSPELEVDRTVDAENVVVVMGRGVAYHRLHGPMRFSFNDTFTFRDDLVERIDSYVVPIT